MAGDLAQRIHRRQFSRGQAGIDLPSSRSRALGTADRVKCAGCKQLPGQVQLTTLHQGKGLEWDYVWLFGLSDAVIPGSFARSPEGPDQDDELHRARRLVYMAMTRGRRGLTLAATGRLCRFFGPVAVGIIQDVQPSAAACSVPPSPTA